MAGAALSWNVLQSLLTDLALEEESSAFIFLNVLEDLKSRCDLLAGLGLWTDLETQLNQLTSLWHCLNELHSLCKELPISQHFGHR